MLFSERANQSIQQLSSALEQLSSDGEEVEEPRGRDGSLFADVAEEDTAAWSQKTQSEAVNQLKSLLLKQGRDISSPLTPSKKPSPSKRVQQEGRSNLPAFQDLVPMIHNQSDYIQHLEAEVKLCKEELHEMKQRIRVVVVENEKFHSELKSKAVDESLKEYTIHNSMVTGSLAANNHSMLHTSELTTWKNELEQFKVIYQAQIESLEAQVISLRKDLSVSQKECEEVKDRLRHREKQAADALRADGAPRVAGERDELLVALRAVRASQQEAQQREWSACLQVKQAVEMAEEANLYKARTPLSTPPIPYLFVCMQVEVQSEQLSRELARLREHLEREAQAFKERLAEAREEGRAEARKQREELAHTMCVDLRYQLSQAQLKKEEAERELRELNSKSSQRMEKAAQVRLHSTRRLVQIDWIT
ncbi:Serologically defined colon cancer antigen 8 [Liparis tanakae]|uniref:Serologically defined colon cancer antigen 8 n=1 Tax=Liparis tanakae TaxID=230148 RepID=A0A4Z2HHH3_9TELE|nr:Serologically defined colon cancer antigen 8 [Liparis tanakae]